MNVINRFSVCTAKIPQSPVPPLISLIPPLVASGALRQTFDNVIATSLEQN